MDNRYEENKYCIRILYINYLRARKGLLQLRKKPEKPFNNYNSLGQKRFSLSAMFVYLDVLKRVIDCFCILPCFPVWDNVYKAGLNLRVRLWPSSLLKLCPF